MNWMEGEEEMTEQEKNELTQGLENIVEMLDTAGDQYIGVYGILKERLNPKNKEERVALAKMKVIDELLYMGINDLVELKGSLTGDTEED